MTLLDYFTKLDSLSKTNIESSSVDTFINGFSNSELTSDEVSNIKPWISLLPVLFHLAGNLEEKLFSSLTEHCVKHNILTLKDSSCVFNAMAVLPSIFESSELFKNNWLFLESSIESNVDANNGTVGHFTCD